MPALLPAWSRLAASPAHRRSSCHWGTAATEAGSRSDEKRALRQVYVPSIGAPGPIDVHNRSPQLHLQAETENQEDLTKGGDRGPQRQRFGLLRPRWAAHKTSLVLL